MQSKLQQVRLTIGRVLFVGICFSFVIIILGSLSHLYENGRAIVSYHTFHSEPISPKFIVALFSGEVSMTSHHIIIFGLLILFFMQFLRVMLTTWYFIKEKSILFVAMSTFIFMILLFSIY